MARIGILGSEGRMGQAIAQAVAASEHECSGGADRGGDHRALAGKSDVLIDFSAPDALRDHVEAARTASVPILIGTTGLDDKHHRLIDEAAAQIPVLQTGNTSLGVTLLAHLVRTAAVKLGPEWDIEIFEMHHRRKVDAPSGTALLLGEAAAEGRGIDLARHSRKARDGHTGERDEGVIGFASLRGGTVAGEHEVIFAGEQERLTLSHSAQSREIFAKGAMRAADWLIGKPPGRYTMDDVLGL